MEHIHTLKAETEREKESVKEKIENFMKWREILNYKTKKWVNSRQKWLKWTIFKKDHVKMKQPWKN
jgi:hypothetical protein